MFSRAWLLLGAIVPPVAEAAKNPHHTGLQDALGRLRGSLFCLVMPRLSVTVVLK